MKSDKVQLSGIVYWLTGLSAAGKTTIGRELVGLLRAHGGAVVFLDGDELREVFGNDLGHTEADRRKSAMRNARLCKLLCDQGLTVVCATISLFHDVQSWNRENISTYREIYVSAPIEVVKHRDPKKIYRRALNKKDSDVVGLSIHPEFPKHPDLTVVNDGSKTAREVAGQILNHFLNGSQAA